MNLNSAKSLLRISRLSNPNLGIIFKKSTLQGIYIWVRHLELQWKVLLVSPTSDHFWFHKQVISWKQAEFKRVKDGKCLCFVHISSKTKLRCSSFFSLFNSSPMNSFHSVGISLRETIKHYCGKKIISF